MRTAGKGMAEFHCQYHVQFKARHGSHWCGTYRAADFKPYVASAASWLEANRKHPEVVVALAWLDALMASAGPVEMAQNLKRSPAAYRAKVAFARLREAGVGPERMLAIHLGVSALIADDRGSHRTDEFRLVQIAKALHRLASGTHKQWQFDTGRGVAPIRLDVYPKSSGLVLRLMGSALEEHCREVASIAVDAIIAAKREQFGPHTSHLPGWRPLWQRQRDAVRR